MQEYMNCMQEAVQAFHSRRYRESADKYLRAFSIAPGKWTENRWHGFHGYTSVLMEKYFDPSQSDFDALEQIMNDKSEPKLYRCQAGHTLGILRWVSHQRDEAADIYRVVLRLGKKAPEKERRKKVMGTFETPNGPNPVVMEQRSVGRIIDDLTTRVEGNLKQLESTELLSEPDLIGRVAERSRPVLRSDGSYVSNTPRVSLASATSLGSDYSPDVLRKLTAVGGSSCDFCGKSREELGVSNLKCCARCKRAYYCSAECQRNQWKAGHKEYCRADGEFKTGDCVRLCNIQSRPEINGEIVKVGKALPDSRWEVKIMDGRSISIASDKMQHLRPLK